MPRARITSAASLRAVLRALALPAALPLAACSDDLTPLGAAEAAARPALETVAVKKVDRLATIEREGERDVLYLQNADGSDRVRVHFQNVHDHVAGNYAVPVTDETVLAIRRAKWSPDGQHLAVIVVPALDASQIVLVSADGRDIRTVSPNSQYLFGDVEWSPDSRRIAYTMGTGAYGSNPDLFVTELGPDQVRQVTSSGKVTGYDTFRFDPYGQRITFTEHLGWSADGVNVLSRLARADLNTGAVTEGDTIVGEPQGITRDGSWGLFIRRAGGDASVRELVRLPLAGGTETVLASGALSNAVLLEGDGDAIVVAPDPADRSGVAQTFGIFGVGAPNDVRGRLPTGGATTWASLVRGGR